MEAQRVKKARFLRRGWIRQSAILQKRDSLSGVKKVRGELFILFYIFITFAFSKTVFSNDAALDANKTSEETPFWNQTRNFLFKGDFCSHALLSSCVYRNYRMVCKWSV
ncbi:hypothetical protein CEXT_505411 [Caerostris extrusa]|uniref:Uncharacterized protein n=1 Tax=Caerostris extrusa TaxID=172846 RepID=A0AAV4UCX8_CAEEX|nr:hypothetical protein CEXT_505411 [Caerostris extrusa]